MTLVSLMVSLLLSAPPAPAQGLKAMTPQQLFETFRDSVVELRVRTPFGDSEGTGFFYRGDYALATACHVIEDATAISVLGTDKKQWQVDMVYLDPANDLALLTLTEHTGRKFMLPRLFENVNTGEDICVLGNPLGLTGSLSKGIVSAKRKEKDGRRFLQIDAAATNGSSGGPVLSRFGEVLGVISFGFDGVQGVTMATVIDPLNEIAFKKGLKAKDYYAESVASFKAALAKTGSAAERAAGLGRDSALDRRTVELNEFASAWYGEVISAENRWRHEFLKSLETREPASRLPRLQELHADFLEALRGQKFSVNMAAKAAALDPDAKVGAIEDAVNSLQRLAKQLIADEAEYLTTSAGRDPNARLQLADMLYRMQVGIVDTNNVFRKQPWFDNPCFYAALPAPALANLYSIGKYGAMADPESRETATVLRSDGGVFEPTDVVVGLKVEGDEAFTKVANWRDFTNITLAHSTAKLIVRVMRRNVQKDLPLTLAAAKAK